MSTAESKTRFTPADLLAMPDAVSYELVDGNLVERPVSVLSSLIGSIIHYLMQAHVLANNLGATWAADASYQCFPDAPEKVRRPEVSFIRKGRLTRKQVSTEGHCSVVPDLAVEVLSPNDSAYDVDVKVQEYLRAGVLLIWIVHPEARTVMVYRADGTVTRLTETNELAGKDVIPNFSVVIRDIFTLAENATS